MKKKLFAVVTAAAMALSLVACGGVTITSVGLPYDMSLEKGATQQLQLEYSADGDVAAEKIAEAAGKLTVEWSSSDEAIVTVDAEGNVTAVEAGEAYVTATVKDKDGLTATTLVRVAVTPTGVEAPETLELVTNGENAKNLDAKIVPEDATGVKLAYESSDEAVATVDENGMVTAVADGECVITAYVVSDTDDVAVDTEVVDAASTDNGKVADTTTSDSEAVSGDATTSESAVSEPAAEDSESAETAESEQVFEPLEQKTAEPEDTTDTEVLDPDFATLMEDLKAETKVTVTTKVDAVTLNQNEGILNVGKSVTLTATVTPEEIAADTTVTWSSSDEAVATVDSNGKVTAVATGNATITATAGEESATCDITVQKATSKPAASSKPTTNSTSGNTSTGASAPSAPAAPAPSNPAPAPAPAPAAPTPAPAAPAPAAPAPEPAAPAPAPEPAQPSGGDTNTDWWNTVIPGAADKDCPPEDVGILC